MVDEQGRQQRPVQRHVTFVPAARPRWVSFRPKKTNHVAHGAAGCLTLGLWFIPYAVIFMFRLTWNVVLFAGWGMVVTCQWLWWVVVGRRRAQRVYTDTYLS